MYTKYSVDYTVCAPVYVVCKYISYINHIDIMMIFCVFTKNIIRSHYLAVQQKPLEKNVG